MIYYDKKYRYLHSLFFLLIAFSLPFVFRQLLGEAESRTWTQTLIVVGCWILVVIVAYKTSQRAYIERLKRVYVSMYEEECDPEKFLSSGYEIAGRFRAPYEVWNVWFLNYCCLANCDIQDELEAERILQEALCDYSETKKEVEKAQKKLALLPALITLRGSKFALDSLGDTEAFLLKNPKRYVHDLQYISLQRKLFIAQESNDYHSVIAIWKELGGQKHASVRLKVIAAYRQSEAHRALGNSDEEVELLKYVQELGGKLGVGRKARSRLEEIGYTGLSEQWLE